MMTRMVFGLLVVVLLTAGVSPAVGDVLIGSGEIRWTGTAEEGPGAPVTVGSLDSDGAQDVRDAMKLAPSAGAPSAGSVDTHLDDLLVTMAAATTSLTVVSAVDGGTITIYRAVTLDATLAGLTIPADYDTVYWTVKTDADLPDTVSTIQVNSDDGLIYLNRAAPADSDLGSITVNQGAGTIGLYLSEEATALLSRTSSLVWSLKALSPAGATLLAVGVVVVRAQATEALS